MSLVIVGNNDGPLTLLKALQSVGQLPVAVGLQKPVDASLKEQYRAFMAADQLWEGFNETQLLARLEPLQPRWVINCFCNFKFKELLKRYECLNVHLAPLPRYRGRHPLPWALINGEKEFGVTIHQMTDKIDGGTIYWQATVAVEDGMSVQALRQQLMQRIEKNFAGFWSAFVAGNVSSAPNPAAEATYVARRFPKDSQLTEWHDRDLIYRKVRALRSEAHPAYLQRRHDQILVQDAQRESTVYVGLSSPFISHLTSEGVTVVCGDGRAVQLLGFDPRSLSMTINQKIF